MQVPWEVWEARLVLGSLMKMVVECSVSSHVRVRRAAKKLTIAVAKSHPVGLTQVSPAQYLHKALHISICGCLLLKLISRSHKPVHGLHKAKIKKPSHVPYNNIFLNEMLQV